MAVHVTFSPFQAFGAGKASQFGRNPELDLEILGTQRPLTYSVGSGYHFGILKMLRIIAGAITAARSTERVLRTSADNCQKMHNS